MVVIPTIEYVISFQAFSIYIYLNQLLIMKRFGPREDITLRTKQFKRMILQHLVSREIWSRSTQLANRGQDTSPKIHSYLRLFRK